MCRINEPVSSTGVGGCDATMEAQNNNQPTLDNHNNLYKIPGQEDQVGHFNQYIIRHVQSTYDRETKQNVTCSKTNNKYLVSIISSIKCLSTQLILAVSFPLSLKL